MIRKRTQSVLSTLALAGFASAIAFGAQPSPPPEPPAPPPPEAMAAEEADRAMRIVFGGSFLGVGVAEVDSERAKALKLKEERGVEITNIEGDSPAAKAGLQKGDVVLEFSGQRVEGTEQFVRLVRETPAGRQVKLLISRNGSTQTIAATIGRRKTGVSGSFVVPRIVTPRVEIPEFRIHIPDTPRPMMAWRSPMLGIDAESVDSQLAEFFGVKEGVLVRSVVKASAAEKAGMKAGDVITKVDSIQVDSPRDITNAIRNKGGGSFPVTLYRERKEMTVNVTLEQSRTEREIRPRPRTVRVGPTEKL